MMRQKSMASSSSDGPPLPVVSSREVVGAVGLKLAISPRTHAQIRSTTSRGSDCGRWRRSTGQGIRPGIGSTVVSETTDPTPPTGATVDGPSPHEHYGCSSVGLSPVGTVVVAGTPETLQNVRCESAASSALMALTRAATHPETRELAARLSGRTVGALRCRICSARWPSRRGDY